MSSSHGQSSASSPYGGSCSPPGVSHHPIHQNDYQTTIQHSTNELPTGSEFRDRVQTAPTILRRQRKTTMIENNNTEGKFITIYSQFLGFFMLFGFCWILKFYLRYFDLIRVIIMAKYILYFYFLSLEIKTISCSRFHRVGNFTKVTISSELYRILPRTG